MSKGVTAIGEAIRYGQEGQEWNLQVHIDLSIITQTWHILGGVYIGA